MIAETMALVLAAGQAPETIFTRGQKIELRTSADNGWRACIVTDPGGSNRVARADCEARPTPRYTYPAGEENFSPQGTSDVRLPGSCTTTSPYAISRAIPDCRPAGAAAAPTARPATPQVAPRPVAPRAAPARAPAPAGGTAGLPLGEYGCIGLGTTQLAGMGTKLLPGGRYSDLEGREFGTYRIVGNTIRFTGGVLDGEVGRDIRNNGYNIGQAVSCQKW